MTEMSPYRSRRMIGPAGIPLVALVVTTVAVGLLMGGCGTGGAGGASVDGGLRADLNGAGATFPQPVYVEWIGGFQTTNPGVRVNYQGVGSGAGIEQFTSQTVDFGASDAFMKTEEVAAAEAARPGARVIHIPTVFGSIALAYNLPGVESLRLDSEALAGIFLGTVENWSDPVLAKLNPGTSLPDGPIHTVHRSDSSGTTNAFTSYLSEVSPDWAAGPGKGKDVVWPGGVGGKGNDGVAAATLQTEGAIGYLELAYAKLSGLGMAEIQNKSGNFVAPSPASTSAAADGIDIPADMNLLPLVSNSANPQAYPIVTSTYVLVYDSMPDASKAEALEAFLVWALGDEGTAIATELGYAPLPSSLKEAVLAMVDLIGQ